MGEWKFFGESVVRITWCVKYWGGCATASLQTGFMRAATRLRFATARQAPARCVAIIMQDIPTVKKYGVGGIAGIGLHSLATAGKEIQNGCFLSLTKKYAPGGQKAGIVVSRLE